MKKSGIVFVVFAIILISGCGSDQNMNDYYNQESKSEIVSKEENKVKIDSYDKVTLQKDIFFVSEGEEAVIQTMNYLTSRKCRDVAISVLDTEIADSIYDIEYFSEYDEKEFLTKIKLLNEREGGMTFHLLEDGTFECPREGIDSVIFLVKVKLENKSDEEIEMNIGDLEMVSIDTERKSYESIGYVKDDFYDEMTSIDAYRGYCQLQPKETLETVLVYVYPERRIDSYRVENGASIVLETSEYDYENLYLRCNATGNRKSVSGEYYIHLKLTGR